ncbi:Mu transposase C-terminal domain-containing protein [Aureimonas altamirensis]|uniref:Mu transposase C-terminal domain-containing protein n=1 Tax=Aureimonas altamirensis TaxID=370622 RepID=UPI002036D1DE|nr:Mu transposase C-terminal domain-containing protein [Aureimonas altamirensis]MCM2505618.1 Mu transposase C-terminal domain-containing protein [Aureimonas altamirensis]
MTHPALAPPLAIERYRILEPHLADGVPLADLARAGTVSDRTLQRWLGRYRAEGLAGLASLPRGDRGRLHLPDHLVRLARDRAIKRPRPPVAAIHRKMQELAVAEGHRAPSYSSVARIVRTIPVSQITVASDPAAYRDEHELVHRREASAANEMWQADHTILDILVLDDAVSPVRPWLTVVLDDHSRAIAGYFISLDAPSALNTALALRQAIWRKLNPEWIVSGIPEQLYVDNGSDFVSEHIEQACIVLKIRLIHSLPGRPRGRGKIERLFRTINDMFLPDLPGHLIAGKALSAPALTLDELRVRFETFVCEVYHRRPHGSTREPPIARWQKGGFLPAMPDSLEQLDMLLVHVPKPRKVLRDGIRLMGRRYVEPTLAAFVGEQVEAVYDPRDLTEIHVYHQGRFVCRALSPEHAGSPSLRAIQQARRGVKERDKQALARTEVPDGDQESTTSRPTTVRGLRLYAADD